MTRGKKFKRKVLERMAETGENYTTARARLASGTESNRVDTDGILDRAIVCPWGHDHLRLVDEGAPSMCADCGSEVVHADGIKRDYAVWCTNHACARHACHDVYDSDCPAWAHGVRA